MRRCWQSFALATLVVVPGVAYAQEHSLAVSQFERGLEAMKSGDYATACPALAESLRLDKRPGTLFTLADCEASWGKLASALAHFGDYMEWYERMPADQKANQRGREQVVPERQKDLRARVPQVTFKAPRVEGLAVELDNVKLGEGSFGVPLPIDPGKHEVTINAPGHEPRMLRFELAERARTEIPLEPGPVSRNTPTPFTEPPKEESSSGDGTRRGLAITAGGVGLVGLGLGAVFGIMTLGHKSTIEDHCTNRMCDAEGLDAVDASKTSGLISTVGFIAAGVGIAAAIVLWPKGASSSAMLRPGPQSSLRRPVLGLRW